MVLCLRPHRQAAQGEDEAANLEIRDDRQGIANPEQTGSNVIVTLREHVDHFFGPIRDSVAPEVVTVIASTARLGVGVADAFITRSIPLASVTVGTALMGIADDILYFASNEPEFRRDEDGHWLHVGPRGPLYLGMGARTLTTLADFAMLGLAIYSLVVTIMPMEPDENTPLLQRVGYGETGVGAFSAIISAAHSFSFLRRARAAEYRARIAAEARIAEHEAREEILGLLVDGKYPTVLERITDPDGNVELYKTSLSSVLLTRAGGNI